MRRPILRSIACLVLASTLFLSVGCAQVSVQSPDAVTYFNDRTDFAGGDNGYAVPIAECDTGTVFATFSGAHRIEPLPLSELKVIDTGTGPLPLWTVAASPMTRNSDWPGGHHPHLTCYPVKVPTVPLFIDDESHGVLPNARMEGHETPKYHDGKHFPVIDWERCDLQTSNARSTLRVDLEGRNSHHGDSGVPRFVVLPDGSLAFLTMEIFLSGGGANHRVYLRMLDEARERDPSVTWKTVRWSDVSAPTE